MLSIIHSTVPAGIVDIHIQNEIVIAKTDADILVVEKSMPAVDSTPRRRALARS